MPDTLCQPHYVQIYTDRGFVPWGSRLLFTTGEFLPDRFDDWWKANDEATKGAAGKNFLCRIFPYYPDYADRERQYIEQMIAEEKTDFEKAEMRHEERLGELLIKLSEVP